MSLSRDNGIGNLSVSGGGVIEGLDIFSDRATWGNADLSSILSFSDDTIFQGDGLKILASTSNSGTFTADNTVVRFESGSLTGGTLASVGSGSFESSSTAFNGINNTGTLLAGGSSFMDTTSSGLLESTYNGSFDGLTQNSGTIKTFDGFIAGSYTQGVGAATVLDNGTIVSSVISLEGGDLSENGSIKGDLNVAANSTLSPSGMGVLDVFGNVVLDGTLMLSLGGTNINQFAYSQLNIYDDPMSMHLGGSISLFGNITFSLADSFIPLGGQFFDVVSAVNIFDLGDVFDFTSEILRVNSRDVLSITVAGQSSAPVPEPSSGVLMMIGICLLIAHQRRFRRYGEV